MSTIFSQGPIRAEARCARTVDGLELGEWDVLICAPSWDRRSVVIVDSSDLSATWVFVLEFENRGTSDLRDTHESQIKDFARSTAADDDHVQIMEGKSEDVELMWEQIESRLNALVEELQRPLRVLLDMSTCPRYFSLAVLGWGQTTGMAAHQAFLYSEGEYYGGAGPELFTTGRWELLPIPYLHGRYDPRLNRMLYVSIGFEGTKTMRAVSQCDPDRVSILFPDPGVLAEYVPKTAKCNAPLIERYCIPDDQITRAPAYDAVSAWKAMTEKSLERPDQENSYYVACGTKPHALAIALRSLAVQYPTVFYTKPGEHIESDIRPSGRIWRYDVTNKTLPHP